MTVLKRGPSSNSQVLATDLDGTLIPLDGCGRHVSDLATLDEQLRTHGVELVFVTGRHFDSVRDAITEHRLPSPDWIICDVGTTIYQRGNAGEFIQLRAYYEHLAVITAEFSIDELRSRLSVIERLREQQSEKQGAFKLSYYANADEIDELQAEIGQLFSECGAPYSVIHSVDPFNGDGLIDCLPSGVSKAHALNWWSRHLGIADDAIVYAGDSGNDLAAFTAGYRTIVVGNAHRALVEQVRDAHQNSGWYDRLFVAKDRATSGVLAGCRLFGLIESTSET
ncbi:MAG: HAD-IIB family hydrolase [Planctomycetes bacterium]|nr:HAD-IIB family hydrolase [Planctomycetota bacterium]